MIPSAITTLIAFMTLIIGIFLGMYIIAAPNCRKGLKYRSEGYFNNQDSYLIEVATNYRTDESNHAIRELKRRNITYHACPDWDYLIICDKDVEFESCGCNNIVKGETMVEKLLLIHQEVESLNSVEEVAEYLKGEEKYMLNKAKTMLIATSQVKDHPSIKPIRDRFKIIYENIKEQLIRS